MKSYKARAQLSKGCLQAEAQVVMCTHKCLFTHKHMRENCKSFFANIKVQIREA